MTSLKAKIRAIEKNIEKENMILIEKVTDIRKKISNATPYLLLIGGFVFGVCLTKQPKKAFKFLKRNLISLQRYLR